MAWHNVALTQALPADLRDDFRSKLHYVSPELARIELDTDGGSVRFQLTDQAKLPPTELGRRIVHVASKLCQGFRPFETRILADRMDRAVPCQDDPHTMLEKTGNLATYGQGRYGLGPLLVRLMEGFDRQFVQMASQFAAEPWQFPTLIGAELLDRCRYLSSFPQSLSVVAHLRPDLEAIDHFAKTARWDGTRLTVDTQDLDAVRCLLSPTVCFHCFGRLGGSTLRQDSTYTAVGKCFRYESGNLNGLERLWDFTMREIILVGSRSFVMDGRQKIIEHTIRLMDEWGLAYSVCTATDPFFIDEFSVQSTFQKAFDLKFELRAKLPYRGPGKDLAIGSFNYHQDFFGRSLNIRNQEGDSAFTSCVGFGLERVALAFLAQYGLEKSRWPEAVVGLLGSNSH